MKATELIIGDIFNLSENNNEIIPCKVVELHTEELLIIQPQDTACDVVGYDMIRPIPITPEILEKNGGRVKNMCDGYDEWWIKLEYYYSYWLLNIIKEVDGSYEYNIDSFPIHYVHELQHALRLCGLNNLADNFKV